MMRRFFLTIALIVVTTVPALAAPGLTFLPQAVGARVTYRIVRNAQTPAGPQTTTSTFALVRRAGTTLVIERTGPNGAPNLSPLKMSSDGTLALADARTSSDGDLADLLYGLNLAIAATREGDPSAGGTWLAVVPVSPAPGATSAPVVLVPASNGKTTFDFSGSADTSSAPPAPARTSSRSGGMSGGSLNPIALTIHIEGHASNGAATRITIAQTRTVTIAGMPYVNAGSWTVTVLP